jgi:[ribosomal protein S18]-alanine N-acetyltransferase
MTAIKVISKSNDKTFSPLLWNLEKEIFGDSSWTEKNLDEHLSNHNTILYTFNEKIVAYLLYLDGIESNELLRIGVLPDFRRKGFAIKLIQSLINLNKSIYLEVRSDNLYGTTLYEKMGFKMIGKRKKYYNDGMDGLVYLLAI